MPRPSTAGPGDMHHSSHSMILTCIRAQHFSVIGHTTEVLALSATKAAQEHLPKQGHTTYASFSQRHWMALAASV